MVFDRSHYEDVLVVRVHDLVPPEDWRRRYEEINAFERRVAEAGTTIVKCMLHISYDEQRERLLARLDDPSKHWNFREGDIDERGRWEQYMAAYEDAIAECSTDTAPWYVVPADRKWSELGDLDPAGGGPRTHRSPVSPARPRRRGAEGATAASSLSGSRRRILGRASGRTIG